MNMMIRQFINEHVLQRQIHQTDRQIDLNLANAYIRLISYEPTAFAGANYCTEL